MVLVKKHILFPLQTIHESSQSNSGDTYISIVDEPEMTQVLITILFLDIGLLEMDKDDKVIYNISRGKERKAWLTKKAYTM